MYEFIVLAQLMIGPAHGYLIAKIINDMIGPYARISYGRLYPLLAKLEENGLIEAVKRGKGEQEGQQRDHKQRIYKITDAGRVRFLLLMNDTNSNPGDYAKLFAHKVAVFAFVRPGERLRLIDHYLAYCRAHVQHMQTEAIDLARTITEIDELQRESPYLAEGFPRLDDESLKNIMNVMQHWIEQWEREIEWAKSLREKETAGLELANELVQKLLEGKVAGNES